MPTNIGVTIRTAREPPAVPRWIGEEYDRYAKEPLVIMAINTYFSPGVCAPGWTPPDYCCVFDCYFSRIIVEKVFFLS